jgi:uncharacterized protein YydD (DUF2326 family)
MLTVQSIGLHPVNVPESTRQKAGKERSVAMPTNQSIDVSHRKINISLFSLSQYASINVPHNNTCTEDCQCRLGAEKKQKDRYHDQAVFVQATHAVSTTVTRIASDQRTPEVLWHPATSFTLYALAKPLTSTYLA